MKEATWQTWLLGIVAVLAAAGIVGGVVLYGQVNTNSAILERVERALTAISEQSGYRYTSNQATVDWAKQHDVDAAQDSRINLLDARLDELAIKFAQQHGKE